MDFSLLIAALSALGLSLAAAADDPSKPETPPKDPGKREPAKPPVKTEPDAAQPDTLIGLSLADAEAAADKAKLPHRVVSVDGQMRMVTRDMRPERLNFTVVNGKITKVTKG